MVSFIEPNQWKGIWWFLGATSLLSLILLDTALRTVSGEVATPVSGFLFEPFAYAVSSLFWMTWYLTLGTFFSRLIFGGIRRSEVFIVSGVLATLTYPFTLLFLSYLSVLLHREGGFAPASLTGPESSVALFGIFSLMLLSILLLIGKEALKAGKRGPAKLYSPNHALS
jgi:hypothetical protein